MMSRLPYPDSFTEVFFVPGPPGLVFPDQIMTSDQGTMPELDSLMFHGLWRHDSKTVITLPPDPSISRYAPRVHAPKTLKF